MIDYSRITQTIQDRGEKAAKIAREKAQEDMVSQTAYTLIVDAINEKLKEMKLEYMLLPKDSFEAIFIEKVAKYMDAMSHDIKDGLYSPM